MTSGTRAVQAWPQPAQGPLTTATSSKVCMHFINYNDTSLSLADKNCETLKDHLMEELDYILLPQAAWHKLVVWYGLSKGSRPIPRQVIEYGLYMKHCKVEVYLLVFSVYEQSKGPGSPHTLQFSKAITVCKLPCVQLMMD